MSSVGRRVPIEHGVERGDFVDTHRRNFNQRRNVIHDRKAGKAVLTLRQVEQRNDGGLFVVCRVLCHNGLGRLQILGIKFKLD
jgi:hypothetical protein